MSTKRRDATSPGSQRLRDLLGDDPPASVAALDPEAQEKLATVIDTARARQSAALLDAFDAALKHVPFPARKLVKKVLLG